MRGLRRALAIVKRQSRPWRFLGSRILWRTRLCTLFRIDCGSFELIFFPTSHSAALWIDPESADDDQQVVASLLRPGDFAVDVGANIGVLTLEASRAVGPSGRVQAFEAHPRIAGYLEKNVEHNHATNVRVLNVALAAEHGTLSFHDLGHSDTQNHVDQRGISALTVPARPLDEFIDPADTITLLKIDVEGYERFVFEGAHRVLDRVDFVYFELAEGLCVKYGYGARDVSTFLTGRGFELFRLSPGRAERLAADYRPDGTTLENILATRNTPLLLERWVSHPAARRVSLGR